MSINIDLDDNSYVIELRNNLNLVLGNRVVKSFLKDFLSADFSQENIIKIPFNINNARDSLDKIENLFKRYSIDFIYSERIRLVLHNYFEEERAFKIFSKKAEDIRNNKCEKSEFEEFTKVIRQMLPNRTLQPLQLLSAFHIAFSQNACNFSVPGSGKTTIVYAAYSYLKSLPANDPKHVDSLLVIGPLSSFGPWEDEYRECFGKSPSSKRLIGTMAPWEKKSYLFSMNISEINLISYQGAVSISDSLIDFLKMHKVMVVLDEAHKIKNAEFGVTAKSVLSLSEHCKSRVVLTGTPAPNGYQDIYNLYKFIWPTKEIIPFRLFHLKEMSLNQSDKRIKQLIESISPFFLRIKKKDLNLPVPTEHPKVVVQMGPEQRKIYDFIEKKYMGYFIDNKKKGSFKAAIEKARIIRLMQAATNPSLLKKPLEEYYHEQGLGDEILIDDSEILKLISQYDSNEIPSKFIEIEKIIKSKISKGEKVLIWTTFVQNILDLEKFLKSKGINSAVIYGQVPVDSEDNENLDILTREKIIKEFHKPDSAFKVLIANPFSVSESISLHKACHTAIYLERDFNAGRFIQSKDRIHRLGLLPTDSIEYFYVVSDKSIDHVIHDRLKTKEKLMLKLIESEEIPLFFNVNNDELADLDIKAIIQDYVQRSSNPK